MTPAIRPATIEDAGFVVDTILLAQRGPTSRGWFDIALDRSEPQCREFVRQVVVGPTKTWWHFSHFMIAEVDDEPAAALCALPVAGALDAAERALREAARAKGFERHELAAMFQRGDYSDTCWVQGADGDWLIEHVASQASHRGRGLMQALIAQALAAGRAAGHSRASITFLIGNEPAERCYAKAGFVFAEEKRHPQFEAVTGAPGFRRFSRAI